MYSYYQTCPCPYYANTPQYNSDIIYNFYNNFRCPYWPNTPIKLYSIYAPPQHTYGTVNVTKADAEAAEEHRGYYYQNEQSAPRQTKEFTLSELAQYDGAMGKPAYVAVNGVVYDVSNNSKWSGGVHYGLIAGKDLSNQFANCHGMSNKLAKLPKVGVLKR